VHCKVQTNFRENWRDLLGTWEAVLHIYQLDFRISKRK
jgi:hypothetical protein